MRNFFSTNPHNSTAMVIRIFLGLVIFPHGAQKLLGWFGGYGYSGTMGFLTGTMHLPYILGLLVIVVEFFGALMLIFGLATRLAALSMLGNFLGIIFTAHLTNGFFINWSNTPNKGHGIEYHLLVIGICIALLITGGGRASLDAAFQVKNLENAHLKRPQVA